MSLRLGRLRQSRGGPPESGRSSAFSCACGDEEVGTMRQSVASVGDQRGDGKVSPGPQPGTVNPAPRAELSLCTRPHPRRSPYQLWILTATPGGLRR